MSGSNAPGTLSRRRVLRVTLLAGTSVLGSGLLAACGGGTAVGTSSAGAATISASSANAAPTTSAAATSAATATAPATMVKWTTPLPTATNATYAEITKPASDLQGKILAGQVTVADGLQQMASLVNGTLGKS